MKIVSSVVGAILLVTSVAVSAPAPAKAPVKDTRLYAQDVYYKIPNFPNQLSNLQILLERLNRDYTKRMTAESEARMNPVVPKTCKDFLFSGTWNVTNYSSYTPDNLTTGQMIFDAIGCNSLMSGGCISVQTGFTTTYVNGCTSNWSFITPEVIHVSWTSVNPKNGVTGAQNHYMEVVSFSEKQIVLKGSMGQFSILTR